MIQQIGSTFKNVSPIIIFIITLLKNNNRNSFSLQNY